MTDGEFESPHPNEEYTVESQTDAENPQEFDGIMVQNVETNPTASRQEEQYTEGSDEDELQLDTPVHLKADYNNILLLNDSAMSQSYQTGPQTVMPNTKLVYAGHLQ